MHINYSYLRPKKAEVLKKWHNSLTKRTDLSAPVYHNATVLPLRHIAEDTLLFGRGGVVDSEKNYIELSSIDRRVQYAYDFDDAAKKDETIVYCGYLVPQWGHFLIEATARLWYVFENDYDIDKYVFFIEENQSRSVSGNYKEFFELLGIWDKIEIINRPVQYKTVVIPELGYGWIHYYSDQYKKIYRTVASNIIPKLEWSVSNKIYLSRSKLKNIEKKEFGLDMLDDFFSNNGFEILYPEQISLSELIYKMESAETVATLSGSLPHNLLFTEDCKNVLILERNVLNNEIQADINQIKDLNVTYIDANIPIYSIDLGYGPFIMAYDGLLKSFSVASSMKAPSNRYMTKKYMKSLFKKYIRAYEKAYHYEWYMDDWAIKYTDYIREGYSAGRDYYRDFLTGQQPFLLKHYFMPHYWKRIVKRMIVRIHSVHEQRM